METNSYGLSALCHCDISALPSHTWFTFEHLSHTQVLTQCSPIAIVTGYLLLPRHYGIGAWMCIISSEVLGWYNVVPWIISSYLFFPLGSAYFWTCSQWNAKPAFLEFVLWTAGWQGDRLVAQRCWPSWMFSHFLLLLGPAVHLPHANPAGPCFTGYPTSPLLCLCSLLPCSPFLIVVLFPFLFLGLLDFQ